MAVQPHICSLQTLPVGLAVWKIKATAQLIPIRAALVAAVRTMQRTTGGGHGGPLRRLQDKSRKQAWLYSAMQLRAAVRP